MPSRTVERVTTNVVGTSHMKTYKKGSVLPHEHFCNAVCDIYCQSRDDMVRALLDPSPKHENVIRSMTDFKTVADMNVGGSCACKCILNEAIVLDAARAVDKPLSDKMYEELERIKKQFKKAIK